MKIQNIASLALLLVAFATGCNDTRDYSGVIATAMQSRQQAYETAKTVIHNQGRTIVQVSLPVFAAEMRKIDVSGCPGDFRAAWNGYLDKVDNAVRKNDSFGYVESFRYGNATVMPGGGQDKWGIPLDHNGMEFRAVWEPLSDSADRHKALPK
jgi:hypothetical protein